MMNVSIERNDYLILTLKGFFGVILPFTNKIKIPYSAIDHVLTNEVKIDKTKTIKFVGTSISNRKIGIFYVVGKGRVFYAFYRKNRCITIKLNEELKFKEVIVEVENKQRIANEIMSRLNRK